MPKLDDERVQKPKSEFELNQEAIMKALTDMAGVLKAMSDKADKAHADFVRFAKAGKF